MANPRLQKLRQLRRQAAGSGNEKRFSNLTNKIRETRGASPLSDAQKAKMFQNQSAKFGGQPDNTTFNRPGMPGMGRPVMEPVRQPLPGGGRIMTGPQQIQGPNAGQPAGLSGVPQVGGQTDFQGRPRPVPYKDGGEVESMPMGERPYKEEKGKKNSMRGVGKAIQGTKFKGVF